MVQTPDQAIGQLGRKLEEVEVRGGSVLIAAFSKNRCSKIALACIELGYVPFVDGSGRTMMRFELGEDRVDLLIKSGKLIFADEDRKHPEIAQEQRRALLNDELGFHPIIAPSGTFEGGYSVNWAKDLLPNPKNAVIFPGYVFPASVSKQVLEMEKGRTISLNVFSPKLRKPVPTPVNVRCEVCHFDGFTSHDYQDGLVERVRLAKPAMLIVHHCPGEESFNAFSAKVAELPNPPTVIWGQHQTVVELR